MKIVILSMIDYAGSAFKLFTALRRHTVHEVDLFSGQPENHLRHPVNILVNPENRKSIQIIVNRADVIHFKGDWPPEDGYLGLDIPERPIVITTSGSFFRKKEAGGIGKYSAKDYRRATVKTSFEPDLLYPEYSDIWTPHPIDSDEIPLLHRQTTNPIFTHIPSSPSRKGTDFVLKVFELLHKKIPCRTEYRTGIPFSQSTALKRISTVYFDQFFVGFYGNAALETMQYGIPTAAWISPTAVWQAKGQLEGCPVINLEPGNPEAAVDKIISILQDDSLALQTKKWCDQIHGFRAVANQWDKIYKQLK